MRLRIFVRGRDGRCAGLLGLSGSRLKLFEQAPRRIALYLSAHGFGHAVRAAAVVEALSERIATRITVLAPGERPRVWPQSLDACTDRWIAEPCDVGVTQTDDVTVDLPATRQRLDGWLQAHADLLAREQQRLAGRFDLVVSDASSLPLEAADSVGIPGVAVANFTWDWIYSELGFSEAAGRAATSYSKATLLLEATPSAPMPAFPRRTSIGLVARKPSMTRPEARTVFGLGDDLSAVLIAFQPAYSASLVLPPPRPHRRYFVPPGWPVPDRSDVVALAAGRAFEDALAAADVVLGKPGYGLIGDVEKAGARFLYAARPGFPENSVLVEHLSARPGTAVVTAAALSDGTWEDILVEMERLERPAAKAADGAQRAAGILARMLAVDSEQRAV
ncbi:MAG TPA: hypothetical protein VN634_13235 [Candidatus Limnocylindrales bacterium]|nr:hypothetical protein [Candidatus Limnocylindrales bacterium]